VNISAGPYSKVCAGRESGRHTKKISG
jgi:hypothetical protein